eukprot:6147565-Pyramimonas_sp.AAC.1
MEGEGLNAMHETRPVADPHLLSGRRTCQDAVARRRTLLRSTKALGKIDEPAISGDGELAGARCQEQDIQLPLDHRAIAWKLGSCLQLILSQRRRVDLGRKRVGML